MNTAAFKTQSVTDDSVPKNTKFLMEIIISRQITALISIDYIGYASSFDMEESLCILFDYFSAAYFYK